MNYSNYGFLLDDIYGCLSSFMDIDGLETMGNMMAMIHHDAPLDYFAG